MSTKWSLRESEIRARIDRRPLGMLGERPVIAAAAASARALTAASAAAAAGSWCLRERIRMHLSSYIRSISRGPHLIDRKRMIIVIVGLNG